MPSVLVVDDAALDRRRAASLLEEIGMIAVYAGDGKEALQIIRRQAPDLVLTDLLMPEMDGLELVEEIRAQHAAIPVILMTAHGSEEIAVKALHAGAASYVPKKNLVRDLAKTVRNVLAMASSQRKQQQVLQWITQTESHFEVGPILSGIEALVGHLQDDLKQLDLCDDRDLVRVGTALHEALVNAIEHGNLELSSQLREATDGSYARLAEQRCATSPYQDRRVRISVRQTRSRATYVIRDEGPGFDPSSLPDPTDPANLEKLSGRGLMLIRTFMDEVIFNDTGNQITMTKRRAG
jgi:CheY-like chemotaxis protein/anti-sigma regulatory factor (Ser/Thr protein kinase)